MWLRGKIHAGEWCYEDVGSCEVKKVAKCDFLLPCNVIKTCMCVSVCVKEVSERVMSRAAGNTDVVNSNELSQLMHRQVDELQQLHAQNERLKVSM